MFHAGLATAAAGELPAAALDGPEEARGPGPGKQGEREVPRQGEHLAEIVPHAGEVRAGSGGDFHRLAPLSRAKNTLSPRRGQSARATVSRSPGRGLLDL